MKVTKKHALGLGAIAVASAFVLSGCQADTNDNEGSETPATTGSLTVWVDAERVDALQGAADAYTDKTGVEVELIGKDNNTIKDDFIQQVPTGEGPDITMGAHDWLGELTTNGVVAPLELGDSAADYLDLAVKAASYDGTVYMLPYGVENIAVLRNADIIPEPAANFDDMIAKGKAAGLDQPFVVEQGAEGNPFHMYPFQTAFGAPVFGTDASGAYDATKLEIGNAGGQEFAAWLSGQGKNGTGVFNTDIDGAIAKDAFLNGTAAFWLTGPWNVSAAVDAGINLEIDPIPSPTSDVAQPFAGVKGFFLSAESENKVAATDFLVNYLGSEDVQLSLFEAGYVPPALSAAGAVAANDPIIKGFQAVGDGAVLMPSIPAMGAVWQYWGVAQASVINGEDPAATWDKLASDVAAAIG